MSKVVAHQKHVHNQNAYLTIVVAATMKEKTDKYEEWELSMLLYELIAKKIGAVSPSEIFSVVENKKTGKYVGFIGQKKITVSQLSQLKQEATMLGKTLLWELFTKTLTLQAELKMLKMAKTERDMDWGKALMHSVGVFENTLKAISNCEVEEG